MSAEKHYLAVTQLAKDYNYKIMSKLTNKMLVFDKIEKHLAIVHYLKENGEYFLNPQKEPEVFESESTAVQTFWFYTQKEQI